MTQTGQNPDKAPDIARLLRHPLRQHVLFKYAENVTSPSAVAAALEQKLNVVSYHTQRLRRAGWIELVRTEQRRGAREHFYRAVVTSKIDDETWERLPTGVRRALVRLTLTAAWKDLGEALPEGGIDAGTAHISRTFLTLDNQGRSALAELLQEVRAAAEGISSASRARTTNDDEVPCELVILSFERASRP